jgi:UDP-N-acetylmuramate: L-alanyl-gamma-D-glutamyl-meso-diaminopimelate ligase
MNNHSLEISEYFRNKTRVLVFTSYPYIFKFLVIVLNFNGKEFESFSENGILPENHHDFVIYETFNLQKAADFQPNIVLITDEVSAEKAESLLENIVAGGTLIYSEKLDTTIERTLNYFRKLSFEETDFKEGNGSIILNTEIGSIPLNSDDKNLIRNINGIKLLSQQFGVMEEDFYEPMMSF